MRYVNFDSLENYYQRLVYQAIISEYANTELAQVPGSLEDVACLALNQLPPRYVRHAVDTAFYISIEEQQEMIKAVREAATRAAHYVMEHPRQPLTGELPRGELPA